jgi:hypothetical protein
MPQNSYSDLTIPDKYSYLPFHAVPDTISCVPSLRPNNRIDRKPKIRKGHLDRIPEIGRLPPAPQRRLFGKEIRTAGIHHRMARVFIRFAYPAELLFPRLPLEPDEAQLESGRRPRRTEAMIKGEMVANELLPGRTPS